MIVGTGKFKYRVSENWGRGAEGREFGEVVGMAVDSSDRVHVATREPEPCVLVFDTEGHFLTAWGQDVFVVVGGIHGLFISAEDHVYCADALDHTVRKFTIAGELLMTLGTPGQTGPPDAPFNMPTKAVLSPSGEIFVSDGYGQSRIHRFTQEGALLRSWGSEGAGPGEFNTPHGIWVDPRGRVLVADRENNRVQVFDADGVFLAEWPMPGPSDFAIDKESNIYVSDGVFNLEGERLAHLEELRAHALCIDSRGDIYWSTVGGENLVKKLERV